MLVRKTLKTRNYYNSIEVYAVSALLIERDNLAGDTRLDYDSSDMITIFSDRIQTGSHQQFQAWRQAIGVMGNFSTAQSKAE